jgi:hypothetical protein
VFADLAFRLFVCVKEVGQLATGTGEFGDSAKGFPCSVAFRSLVSNISSDPNLIIQIGIIRDLDVPFVDYHLTSVLILGK